MLHYMKKAYLHDTRYIYNIYYKLYEQLACKIILRVLKWLDINGKWLS